MPIDHQAAENFIWSAARLVDRHRYSMLFADGPAEPVIDALSGYRNPGGGFGHALELVVFGCTWSTTSRA